MTKEEFISKYHVFVPDNSFEEDVDDLFSSGEIKGYKEGYFDGNHYQYQDDDGHERD